MINMFGGALVMVMGIRLFARKGETGVLQNQVSGHIQMFLSSFAVGITNPAAILTFLFAFSYFGITKEAGWAGGVQLDYFIGRDWQNEKDIYSFICFAVYVFFNSVWQ